MNKKYQRYINFIVNDIEAPYFINMVDQYGLRPDEYPLILDKVFNQPVTIEGNYVYNTNGKLIYHEDGNGYCYKNEYDNQGNNIYFEDSNGDWNKSEYDQYGNNIYFENSYGYWYKKEYDSNGKVIYYEDSRGYWDKYEYDRYGNVIYHEENDGVIIDNR